MGEPLDSFRVLNTPDKGRVCVATRTFRPGDVVFEDRAFVHASELPYRCLACCGDHTVVACDQVNTVDGAFACPVELLSELDTIAADISDLEAVNTLDRARCFIQCMLMYHKNPLSLEPIANLTAANLPRCLESVAAIREYAPALFPEGMTDESAAYVLGSLNTNSHELEEVEGSGLFLLACIMEHDCNPNCSFTTFEDTIWLTAIREVGRGDRLSIDYGNNFYMPTADRRAELEEVYGFVCNCRGCTVLPDRCRSFHCPSNNCHNGKVCPHGDGGDGDYAERNPKNWGCLICGHQCLPAEILELVEAEESLVQALESVDDLEIDTIDQLLAEARVVHPTHYAVFWAMESTAKRLSRKSAVRGSSHRAALQAEVAWSRVAAAVEEALPALHHEKVVFLDALAQARVVAGDIEGAREAYKGAYQVSAMVSGADTPPTLDVKSLWERPPLNAAALRARYKSSA